MIVMSTFTKQQLLPHFRLKQPSRGLGQLKGNLYINSPLQNWLKSKLKSPLTIYKFMHIISILFVCVSNNRADVVDRLLMLYVTYWTECTPQFIALFLFQVGTVWNQSELQGFPMLITQPAMQTMATLYKKNFDSLLSRLLILYKLQPGENKICVFCVYFIVAVLSGTSHWQGKLHLGLTSPLFRAADTPVPYGDKLSIGDCS